MLPRKTPKVGMPQPLQLLSPRPQQVLDPHHIHFADAPVLLQAVPGICLYACTAGLLLLGCLAQYCPVEGQHLTLNA